MRVAAAVAVALAVAFVAWLVLRDGQPEDGGRAPATAMSADEVRAFAGASDKAVYWAGERPPGTPPGDVTYEVTETSNGAVYVRYLPLGVDPGAEQVFLTIATYLDARARASIRTAVARPGAIRVRGPGGRLAVAGADRPESVYLASPTGREQIEVFDPDAARAREIAALVQPVR